jgi:hypothetical protein
MESGPTAAPSNEMPGMDSAPAMAQAPETAHSVATMTVMLETTGAAGVYTGDITFTAAGHWMVTTHLTMRLAQNTSATMFEAGFGERLQRIVGKPDR